jgi:predicted ATPase
VRTRNAEKDVTLSDVGFGVSQILPVLVECFYAAPNSTIVMEQPEIHLHPKAQFELADLFIEVVSSREANADRGIQLIIESHSEHFLLRLQRRIAEGAIDPENVALYYCEPGSSGATLRGLKANLFGEISDWPDDFFGDEMSELRAQIAAAAKKRAAEAK